MKKLALIFLGCSICCGQTNIVLPQKRNFAQERGVDGVYEYVYPRNVKGLVENQYIVLKAGAGLYYGTSDEFDSAREGVPPGFFVAGMQELRISGDSIGFKLKITSTDLFEKPVALKFKSSADAKRAGYKLWKNKIPLNGKWYYGKINNHSLHFKDEIAGFDKKFLKRGSN